MSFDQRSCADVNPEEFYPDDVGSIQRAKRICKGSAKKGIPPCPVKEQCLALAMKLEADHPTARWGVWGGTSAKQRVALGRRRRK